MKMGLCRWKISISRNFRSIDGNKVTPVTTENVSLYEHCVCIYVYAYTYSILEKCVVTLLPHIKTRYKCSKINVVVETNKMLHTFQKLLPYVTTLKGLGESC